MPSFADSFWSGDYAGGLGVLFDKLHQGIVENEQVLTIARLRAEAEDQYGRRLGDINPTTERLANGFQRDDGASLKKAYEGVRTEMNEASKTHQKIANNINELVVVPFGRWCDAHENRVLSSHDNLQARIKAHDKQAELVRKLRSAYFNKCRQLEDLEEESKLGFQEPEKTEASPKGKTPTLQLPSPEATEDLEPIEIGDDTYSPERLKGLLTDMLSKITVGETKVSILGTYTNVSTGADIVEYMQKSMNASSVSYAERLGQDLVANGFLRLVGNVGNTFANSSRMYYQWRTKTFQITGLPEKRKLERIGSSGSEVAESPVVGSMGDMLQGWNPLNNPFPNETPSERMRREARESDDKYKQSVKKLDSLRCNLEETMVDHLKFMEQCELDRLKALKAVMLDFSGSMSNVIPSLQSTVDNMMLYQEAVQPAADLRYLLENYKTGSFFPKVQTYDNYYNNIDGQTFGVDLEARARADRKRVPVVITSILTFLDNHYPDLEGDEVRRNIWTVDVPLAATHHLRSQINNGEPPPREVLERYEVPIVASVLKLYLLELPDSLVSSQVYEVVKTVYSSPESSNSDSARVSVLQNTLGQLRLANIATLDAITTHFTRLIELTSADEAYITNLAQMLSPCILRPRVENTLTMHERHAYRLIRDLFDHKDAIFGELKRASSQSGGGGGGGAVVGGAPKPVQKPSGGHAPTTDESNRRANMEARTKAIMSRSRATSPSPVHIGAANGNRHRRDRSVGDPHMRFPVVASPTAGDHVHRRGRASLEVPDPASPPRVQAEPSQGSQSAAANGTSSTSTSAETSATMTSPPGAEEPSPVVEDLSSGVEKKSSLSRGSSAAQKVANRRAAGSASGSALNMISRSAINQGRDSRSGSLRDGQRDSHGSLRDSMGSLHESRTSNDDETKRQSHGVELTDKPMDF